MDILGAGMPGESLPLLKGIGTHWTSSNSITAVKLSNPFPHQAPLTLFTTAPWAPGHPRDDKFLSFSPSGVQRDHI